MSPAAPLLAEYATEATVDAYVLAAASAGGWTNGYHTHRSDHSASGFPDRILIHAPRGLIVAAELKGYDSRRRLGRPSAEQLDWLAAFRAAGVAAFLWTPADADLIVDVLVRRRVPHVDDLPPLPPLAAPRRARRHR